jgi:predicted kinase
MAKTLILTVGLPRSGKSTWAKQQGHPVVSPDAIRLALHGQAFVPSAEGFVWAIAHGMVAALFLAGHDVVILDACNTSKKLRDEWKSKEWQRIFQVFDASMLECQHRAMIQDRTDLIAVINRMAAGYEPVSEEEQSS